VDSPSIEKRAQFVPISDLDISIELQCTCF
jgi:hypothetical protein